MIYLCYRRSHRQAYRKSIFTLSAEFDTYGHLSPEKAGHYVRIARIDERLRRAQTLLEHICRKRWSGKVRLAVG